MMAHFSLLADEPIANAPAKSVTRTHTKFEGNETSVKKQEKVRSNVAEGKKERRPDKKKRKLNSEAAVAEPIEGYFILFLLLFVPLPQEYTSTRAYTASAHPTTA